MSDMTLQSGHSVAMQRVVTCEPLLTSYKVTKPQSTRPKLRHGNFSNLLLASKSKSAQGGERGRGGETADADGVTQRQLPTSNSFGSVAHYRKTEDRSVKRKSDWKREREGGKEVDSLMALTHLLHNSNFFIAPF